MGIDRKPIDSGAVLREWTRTEKRFDEAIADGAYEARGRRTSNEVRTTPFPQVLYRPEREAHPTERSASAFRAQNIASCHRLQKCTDSLFPLD